MIVGERRELTIKRNKMKNIILTVIALFGLASIASAQCGDDLMKKALGAMGGYQYIKDFDIKVPAGAADGATFSIVLNSRTHYQINVANGASNPEHVTIKIFDASGKLIGINASNGKVFDTFQFICGKTGAYKLQVTCSGEACARAVLSLVKQYTEAEMP
jgi:hypothetical protein